MAWKRYRVERDCSNKMVDFSPPHHLDEWKMGAFLEGCEAMKDEGIRSFTWTETWLDTSREPSEEVLKHHRKEWDDLRTNGWSRIRYEFIYQEEDGYENRDT